VTPHTQNLHCSLSQIDFVNETMLPIDPTRIKTGEIADKLLKWRWVATRIVSQNGKQFVDFSLQSRPITYQSKASEH
jgi:hypothetical protein